MYLQAATKGQVKEMPELPSGITISKIKNASSATRSGAQTPETTVRFFAETVEVLKICRGKKVFHETGFASKVHIF